MSTIDEVDMDMADSDDEHMDMGDDLSDKGAATGAAAGAGGGSNPDGKNGRAAVETVGFGGNGSGSLSEGGGDGG